MLSYVMTQCTDEVTTGRAAPLVLPYDTLTFLKFGVRSLVMGLTGRQQAFAFGGGHPARFGFDIPHDRRPTALIDDQLGEACARPSRDEYGV